jgi:DNA polymerase III epsilon subunit family exonuclease
MIFVALDLETTGLSPETDTIIEVAAIRFEIIRDGNKYTISNIMEHSQLIYPEKPLSQEVSMITGITSDMLIGKPIFSSVRDKIADFIGDSIIVGHNVLFDIAMFGTHGIDLSKNIVLDTFELSEIFSQDVESLNLGFLAAHYGLIDPTEEEHRALTDTRVSVRLFLNYLSRVGALGSDELQIWHILSEKDQSQTLKYLSKICNHADNIGGNFDLFESLLGTKMEILSENTLIKNDKKLIHITSNIEELKLIKHTIAENKKIELVTIGYKTAVWISDWLTENNIENIVKINPSKRCSVENMIEILQSEWTYDRKMLILILKISFWMIKTETGILDELKFYGAERDMIDEFRSSGNDYSLWQEKYDTLIKNTTVVISTVNDIDISHIDGSRQQIIKDITLIEDIVRRKESREISFDDLYESIGIVLSHTDHVDIRVHMTDMLSIVRGIYEGVSARPSWPDACPPGNYWETYFFTQAMLWHSGHKWLIHASGTLSQIWGNYIQKEKSEEQYSKKIQLHRDHIQQCLSIFDSYHNYGDTNTNIIININQGKTKVTLIPQSVTRIMSPLLERSIAYWYQLSGTQTAWFLKREYGYNIDELININGQIHQTNTSEIHERCSHHMEYHVSSIKPGTVILTTSMKHARDLGQELRKIYGKNTEVLIQWLSGGKSKMMSIFRKNIEKTILIGIIDTWRDEYLLWQKAKRIIIAKLPFDPPTDPFFLARTVGMSNNFSEYSEPIAIIRINSLIERIQSSRSDIHTKIPIYITDSRLVETEWWKRIWNELL